MLRVAEYSERKTRRMTDDTQAADTTSDAEPTALETSTTVVETPAQAPEKKARRGAKAAKTAKPAKAPRARKADKAEEVVAPAPKADAEPVARTARKGRVTSAAKATKSTKPKKAVAPALGAKTAGSSKRAKPEKAVEAVKATKPAKVAKSPMKSTKAAPTIAAKPSTPATARQRDKGANYTTNELNSAVKKAGLTIDFNPVVTKLVSIGRGPAKEFKVDAIIAHLRGSNGDLIKDRGPGTPLYNDAESLAAVEIFEKFRGRTFHNKLKVEIF